MQLSSSGSPALEARSLAKRYDDVVALDGIDLEVHRGSCLGLLGPNGAGKTTTVEIFVGLLLPDAGAVRVLGEGWKEGGRALRARIGVQLQETRLPDKNTVWEILTLFRSFYAQGKRPAEVLDLIGLTDKKNARVEKLSGGQRQRLALGCALIHDPEVLFLDEPTTGLDPQARRTVWDIIEAFKARGGTVLLTTHFMDEAERLSENLVILDRGKVLKEGTPRDIVDELQGNSIVEFTLLVEGGAEVSDAEPVLKELAGVHGVQRRGERYSLAVAELEQGLPALIDAARERRWRLEQLHTHRPTLDDVFVSLTGRRLHDDQGSGNPRTGENPGPASPA